MLQHRKKDYFQRIIEEFFAKLRQMIIKDSGMTQSEKRELLNEGFNFYLSHFDVGRNDLAVLIIHKIEDVDLIEYYARLLKVEYETIDIKYRDNLLKSLSLIDYLQKADASYSWERTILREDILRLLEDTESK